MKKIVLVSHCALNSMCELPPASDEYRKGLLGIAGENGWDIIQLPCPELSYQGLERESIYPGTEKAWDYGHYCWDLLTPLFKNLREYIKYGYQFIGIIGIETSPSCSIKAGEGIMMGLIMDFLKTNGVIDCKLVNMPVESGDESFLAAVKEWV